MLLKDCSYIVTQDEKRRVLRDKDILIDGGYIKAIGRFEGSGIDCRNKIVMPGLINTHAHLGMHSLKGICDDEAFFTWLGIVNSHEEGLDADRIIKNTEEGARECIRNGTTTVYDSYRFAPERIAVFQKLGLRAFVSSTVTKEKHLKHIDRLLESRGNGLVGFLVAGHSPYRCSESLLRQIVQISERHGLWRRIHISETKKEVDSIVQEKGTTPIRYLDRIGFLSEKTLLIHCIFVDDGEIEIMARRGCSVSHNPISNMKLASGGVSPVVRMLGKGINVGLGTDSVASNNDLDLFEELKVTALLHKHNNSDPKAMTYQLVLDMATISGAKCLGMDDVGCIRPKMKADIITLDLDGLLPINNVASNIVYCANGHNVCETIVGGKVLMRDKRLLV